MWDAIARKRDSTVKKCDFKKNGDVIIQKRIFDNIKQRWEKRGQQIRPRMRCPMGPMGYGYVNKKMMRAFGGVRFSVQPKWIYILKMRRFFKILIAMIV